MLFLTFTVGSYRFGLEAVQVEESLRTGRITPIRGAPQPVPGVINLRGEVIVVIDMAALLGLPVNKRVVSPDPASAAGRDHDAVAPNEISSLVVLKSNNESVALKVDKVSQVVNIETDSIQPTPQNLDERTARLISGVCPLDDNLIYLLNIDSVLNDNALTIIKKSGQSKPAKTLELGNLRKVTP